MTPEQFIKTYGKYAKAVEQSDGISALFSLAQSALETGWGEKVVGNAMFGIKDTDGVNGNEQLITTTEYHNSPNVKYPVVLAVTELVKGKRWKYTVKDWFRKYPTPEESFRDHAKFFLTNKRYRTVLTYKADPYQFCKEVAKAGYATGDGYADTICKIMRQITPAVAALP